MNQTDMIETVKTDKASLDRLLNGVVDLLNADEHSEALHDIRAYFGLVNRWICVRCGNLQTSMTRRERCVLCGADMKVCVVRTKKVADDSRGH